MLLIDCDAKLQPIFDITKYFTNFFNLFFIYIYCVFAYMLKHSVLHVNNQIC